MRNGIRALAVAAALAAGVSAAPVAAQTTSWFARADRDGDGRATWAEYERAQPSYAQMNLDYGARYSRISLPWNRAYAARLDLNRDGRITRSEYSSVLRRAFRRYDLDGDGIATRREVFGSDKGRDGDSRRTDDNTRSPGHPRA